MDKKTAQNLGVAYMLGLIFSSKKASRMAQDDAKWITVKPNGENAKGSPALIDGETGQILGGMGGKFTGTSIAKLRENSQKFKRDIAAARKEGASYKDAVNKARGLMQEQVKKSANVAGAGGANGAEAAPGNTQRAASPGPKIDMTLPDKVDKSLVLQNRARNSEASKRQMENIANKLDYYLVGPSNDFNSGSPVVSYGSIPSENFGNPSVIATQDGKRYQVQYAVVESDSLNASHDANGDPNDKYFSEDPNVTRAIAGNGRLAGLQRAYKKNPQKIEQYKADLNADPSHGVSPDVINKMKNPVLVRVMQPKDITEDIGAKTNQTNTLTLSPVENAKDDARREDVSHYEIYEDGSPTKEAVREFVMSLPVAERGDLLTSEGNPTRLAQDRLMNAIIYNAYGNDEFVRERGEAIDPDGKTFLNAIEKSAQKVSNLSQLQKEYDQAKKRMQDRGLNVPTDAPQYDIKDVLSEVFSQVKRSKKQDFWERNMLADEEFNETAKEIGMMLLKNKRSSARMSLILDTLVDGLSKATQQQINDLHYGGAGGGLLGGLEDVPPVQQPSRLDVVKQSMEKARKLLAQKNKGNEPSQADFGAGAFKFGYDSVVNQRLARVNKLLKRMAKERKYSKWL